MITAFRKVGEGILNVIIGYGVSMVSGIILVRLTLRGEISGQLDNILDALLKVSGWQILFGLLGILATSQPSEDNNIKSNLSLHTKRILEAIAMLTPKACPTESAGCHQPQRTACPRTSRSRVCRRKIRPSKFCKHRHHPGAVRSAQRPS